MLTSLAQTKLLGSSHMTLVYEQRFDTGCLLEYDTGEFSIAT